MKTILKLQCLSFVMITAFIVHFIANRREWNELETYQNHRPGLIGVRYNGQLQSQSGSEHDKAKVSMLEYMKFYKLDPDVHYSCADKQRPSADQVRWHKNTYQRITLQFRNQAPCDLFGLKFYLDDRFLSETGQRHIRCIVAIQGPGNFAHPDKQEVQRVFDWVKSMNSFPWSVLLWYKEFTDPVGVSCRLQAAGGLNRNVSNQYYFQEIITCVIPEIGLLPVSASIVTQPCGHPTTNLEIIYPRPDDDPGHRTIGVCMASFFGNLSRDDVPYFVNWMEALRSLGVKEVSINNGSLKFKDELIKKAFHYYIDSGRLAFTHYPPVHDTWVSPDQDDDVTEGVNKLTTGDCVYRNLKRYWYVLIIDMDELPVPTHFNTYQEYLSDYIAKHDNFTHAHCLTIRSSFFYREMAPGNPEYGEHLPVLRLTKRFRPEPIDVDGVGISKSFHNMRNMVAAGHHITRQSHWGGGDKRLLRPFMSPDDILIHHYRGRCKYSHFCRDHWNETEHDDIMPRKYGTQLQRDIERVLSDIGYHF